MQAAEGRRFQLTEMNVPGRNTIVTAAIVIIEELSRLVSKAILAVRSAMSKFVLLSTWADMLKRRFIISLVRSLYISTDLLHIRFRDL